VIPVTESRTSVLVVITETSPVEALWRAALDRAREAGSELNILIVRDERWHRAASLPFTSEIPRLGGPRRKFTAERAEALVGEAIARLRGIAQALAAESRVQCHYHVVTETVFPELEGLVVGRRSVLVASSDLETLPIFEQARGLRCEIVLVDPQRTGPPPDAAGRGS
jgi:hypothetical protein